MNSVQKRLSIVALTVLLILFASVSLYGQLPAGERFVVYLSSDGHLHTLFAPSGSGWTSTLKIRSFLSLRPVPHSRALSTTTTMFTSFILRTPVKFVSSS